MTLVDVVAAAHPGVEDAGHPPVGPVDQRPELGAFLGSGHPGRGLEHRPPDPDGHLRSGLQVEEPRRWWVAPAVRGHHDEVAPIVAEGEPVGAGSARLPPGRGEQERGDAIAVRAEPTVGLLVDVLVEPQVGIYESGGEDAVHGCSSTALSAERRTSGSGSAPLGPRPPGAPGCDGGTRPWSPRARWRPRGRSAPATRPGPRGSGGSPFRWVRSSTPRPRSAGSRPSERGTPLPTAAWPRRGPGPRGPA